MGGVIPIAEPEFVIASLLQVPPLREGNPEVCHFEQA